MPRPKEVSDDEIMAATRAVFLEQGAGGTIATVAKTLGVSPTALYLRMGSKESLLAKALCPTDPPVLTTLLAGLQADRPANRQLRGILIELLDWAREEMPASFALYAAGMRPAQSKDNATSGPVRLRSALARWLRTAAATTRVACPPRAAADILLGTLEARALHEFITRTPFSRGENRTLIRHLAATILPDLAR